LILAVEVRSGGLQASILLLREAISALPGNSWRLKASAA